MTEVAPRAQARNYMHIAEPHALPIIEDVTEQGREIEVLSNLKTYHYAKLAEAINLLLGDIQSKKPEREVSGFVASKYRHDDPWQQLRADTNATTLESVETIKGSPQFVEAAEVCSYIGSLDSNRYIDLKMQITAGMDTAVSSMLTLLKNIPSIAKFHDASFDGDLAQLAHNSSGLVTRLAMTCVDRMMAAQTALSNNVQKTTWSSFDTVLDPTHFALVGDGDNQKVAYAQFNELVVPEGYENGPHRIPITAPTKIGALACYQDVIIGCPITLLPGRMQELWSWYVDVTSESGML